MNQMNAINRELDGRKLVSRISYSRAPCKNESCTMCVCTNWM